MKCVRVEVRTTQCSLQKGRDIIYSPFTHIGQIITESQYSHTLAGNSNIITRLELTALFGRSLTDGDVPQETVIRVYHSMPMIFEQKMYRIEIGLFQK